MLQTQIELLSKTTELTLTVHTLVPFFDAAPSDLPVLEKIMVMLLRPSDVQELLSVAAELQPQRRRAIK